MPMIRVINPAPTKRNPLGAVLISAMNGSTKAKQKERSMRTKKPRTAKQKAAFKKMLAARGNPSSKHTKKNSIIVYKPNRSAKKNRSAKRNGLTMPAGIAAKAKYIAEGGIGAALGVVTTGATAQKVFGKYDTGWLGYGLNIGLGIIGAKLISKFAKRPVLAAGFLLGTAGSQVRRAYTEKVVKLLPTHVPTASGEVKPLGDVVFAPAAIRALSGYYEGSVGGDGEIGGRLGMGGYYEGDVGNDGMIGSRLGAGMQLAG